MLYLKDKRLLFIHNQKCAGQYISKILGRYMTQADYHIGGTTLGEEVQEDYYDKYGINKHSSVGEVVASDLALDINFFSFATVRDPVDRVISAYRFLKGAPIRPWNRKFIREIKTLSLYEFIESHHLRWLASQYSRVSVDGFMVVDKICKVEEFPHSLGFLRNFDISIKGVSVENESMYGDKDTILQQLLDSPRHLNIIYGVYAKDYKHFGYERR